MGALRIYICRTSAEHYDHIMLITTVEKDAKKWLENNPGSTTIDSNFETYELQGTEFIEVEP